MSSSARGRDRQIVICGLGGQGILFLSRIIAAAAMFDGNAVLTAETHGMSQRGGAVEAHLKVGDFQSSLVRRGSADGAIVLDASRIEAARPWLREGGPCIADAAGDDVEGVHTVDASGTARLQLYERGRNLILLGFASARAPTLLPTEEALRATLDRLSPPPAREENRRAFGSGVELA